MSERMKELDRISDQLSENIVAVKGTLELLDASVTEDDLHELLLKSIERMDAIQLQATEIFAVLKNCLEKIDALNK